MEETNKPQKIYGPSYIWPKGGLAEMINDTEHDKTYFVTTSGEINSLAEGIQPQDRITVVGNKQMFPLKAEDSLIQNGFVKFPSGLQEYEGLSQLYNQVENYIKKYVLLPEDFTAVSAVYVLLSWLYHRFPIIPYLRVLGDYGTGKSRFLEIIGNLCYRPMNVGASATMAAVFRTIDFMRGSLIFDESDFKNSELWSEIIKMLNMGHSANASVIRMEFQEETKTFKTVSFKVFGPKVLASRERYQDMALESRCLTHRLMPQENLDLPIFLPTEATKEAEELQNKLLAFRLLQYYKISYDENIVKEIKNPRIKQTLLSLASVAKLIGDDILDKIIGFGKALEEDLKVERKRSLEIDVLECLVNYLAQLQTGEDEEGITLAETDKIRIGNLAQYFNTRYFDEFNESKPIMGKEGPYYNSNRQVSARKLGAMVNRLGIKTDRDGRGFYIPQEQFQVINKLAKYHQISSNSKPQNDDTIKKDGTLKEEN